jgi:hypothetical protein
MAAEWSLPSFGPGDSSAPVEILASMSPPPMKKGVTLKPGQGILLKGQLLARDSVSSQYIAYNGAGTGDVAVCVGILAEDRDTHASGSTQPAGGNIYMRGTFKRSKLIGLDSGAVADLNAREDVARDYLIVA